MTITLYQVYTQDPSSCEQLFLSEILWFPRLLHAQFSIRRASRGGGGGFLPNAHSLAVSETTTTKSLFRSLPVLLFFTQQIACFRASRRGAGGFLPKVYPQCIYLVFSVQTTTKIPLSEFFLISSCSSG